MKLQQNANYQATVTLSPGQAWAPNVIVAGKFSEAGFANVKSSGTGTKRIVTGVWPKATQEVDLKKYKEVSKVKKV